MRSYEKRGQVVVSHARTKKQLVFLRVSQYVLRVVVANGAQVYKCAGWFVIVGCLRCSECPCRNLRKVGARGRKMGSQSKRDRPLVGSGKTAGQVEQQQLTARQQLLCGSFLETPIQGRPKIIPAGRGGPTSAGRSRPGKSM